MYQDTVWMKMEYNELDRLTRKIHYRDGKINEEFKYYYNSRNLLVKEVDIFTGSVYMVEEKTYKYNSNDKLIEAAWKEYGDMQRKTSSIIYQYNKDNKITNEVHFGENYLLREKFITEYTGDNSKTIRMTRTKIEKFAEQEFENGLLKKKTEYHKNNVKNYETYAYDKHRNLIRKEVFTAGIAKPEIEEWVYAYD